MHSYLRAVGFSDVHSITQLNRLIGEIARHYDDKIIFESEDGRYMAEISREYGEGFGLTVCGEYDENNMFYAEYVFPYFKGQNESSAEDVVIEKHVANDSYTGACDDLRVGTTIIFYLENMGEYLAGRNRYTGVAHGCSTVMSGLCLAGKILLPMEKQDEAAAAERNDSDRSRLDLMQAARDGDEEAMESLSIEDFDTYSMLIERVSNEDVLSIVDTYFMPNGADCECYSVLGTILDVESTRNDVTGEELWRLTIECNDIPLEIGIHKNDLVGEPEIGRRFNGNIWLQGHVYFND